MWFSFLFFVVRFRYDENSEKAPHCEGYNCDCENLVTVTIQGETDSFGFETIDFCESCYNKMLAESKAEEQKLREDDTEKKIKPPKLDLLFVLWISSYCWDLQVIPHLL